MAKPLEVGHFLAFVQCFAFFRHASGRGRYVSPKAPQPRNAIIADIAVIADTGERNEKTTSSVGPELHPAAAGLVGMAAQVSIIPGRYNAF
jgi:hypothetical protein